MDPFGQRKQRESSKWRQVNLLILSSGVCLRIAGWQKTAGACSCDCSVLCRAGTARGHGGAGTGLQQCSWFAAVMLWSPLGGWEEGDSSVSGASCSQGRFGFEPGRGGASIAPVGAAQAGERWILCDGVGGRATSADPLLGGRLQHGHGAAGAARVHVPALCSGHPLCFAGAVDGHPLPRSHLCFHWRLGLVCCRTCTGRPPSPSMCS